MPASESTIPEVMSLLEIFFNEDVPIQKVREALRSGILESLLVAGSEVGKFASASVHLDLLRSRVLRIPTRQPLIEVVPDPPAFHAFAAKLSFEDLPPRLRSAYERARASASSLKPFTVLPVSAMVPLAALCGILGQHRMRVLTPAEHLAALWQLFENLTKDQADLLKQGLLGGFVGHKMRGRTRGLHLAAIPRMQLASIVSRSTDEARLEGNYYSELPPDHLVLATFA